MRYRFGGHKKSSPLNGASRSTRIRHDNVRVPDGSTEDNASLFLDIAMFKTVHLITTAPPNTYTYTKCVFSGQSLGSKRHNTIAHSGRERRFCPRCREFYSGVTNFWSRMTFLWSGMIICGDIFAAATTVIAANVIALF